MIYRSFGIPMPKRCSPTMTASSPTLIRDPWRRLWHFFVGDGFLAAVLIGLALLLLLAVWLPQTPTADPIAYSRWLSEAQTRFSNLFSIFTALGFFSVTNSLLFRLLLALLGWCCALRLIDQLDRVRRADPADRASRRSHLAAITVYAGALVILLGLVLGTFIDYRVDNVVVQPDSMTGIPGTSYTLRLDAVEVARARVALLDQTETIAQGEIAARQPLHDGVAIYLDRIGPALTVSAARGATQTLDLQSTANSPAQPQVLLAFTPDQPESFVAAPQAALVLRVAQSGPGQFTAQIYQSATGKDFGTQPFEPGGSISIEDTTFTFEPAAYVIVSLANQPSHWISVLGLTIALLGLIGLLIWPDISIATRVERAALLIVRVSWPLITLLFIGLSIDVYPRTASPGSGNLLAALEASLAAWLLASGGVITHKAVRLILMLPAILIGALLAVWLGIAASG
jgi:hypothetical protein